MRGHQIARRGIGWIMSVVISVIAGYQLAWHKEEWATVYADRPLQTIGLLVLVVFALCLMVWAVISDSRRSTVAGLVAAFAAGAWGLYVLSGINGWFILASFGVLIALAALAGMTLFVRCPSRTARLVQWWHNRQASRPTGPVDPAAPVPPIDVTVFGPAPASAPHAAAPATAMPDRQPRSVLTSPVVDHSSTPAAPASGSSTTSA